MKIKIHLPNPVRILLIVALVIPLALGGISPAKASTIYTLAGWRNNTSGQLNIPSNLTDTVAIAAGFYHNLALKGDGTVVAWGMNY